MRAASRTARRPSDAPHELLLERKEALAQIVTEEMGKLISEARGEVDLAASILTYYAKHGPEFAAPEPLDVEEGEAYLVSEPLGVLLGVMPWNFPLYQVVRFAGPNLVLGNTVLVKHAGICAQSALALEKIFQDAGLPPGAYTNLFVGHDEVSRIIDSRLVRGASLTGSEGAGAKVAERAGSNLKPSLLELGGSDVFLVLDGGTWSTRSRPPPRAASPTPARAASPPSASSSSTPTTTPSSTA